MESSAKAAKGKGNAAGEDSGDSLYEKKWNEAFGRLKAFKTKYGHCRVPNRYADDPQLGNWVSTQRRQYRILTTDPTKPVPLTQERAQQLIALGFEWCAKDPSHKCWEDRFQELCDYKRKYGSTLVPMGWEGNPRLGTWVSTQRQEYKQLKLGHSSRLNEDKVKLLKDIGFVWEAQRGRRKLSNPARQQALPAGEEAGTGRTDSMVQAQVSDQATEITDSSLVSQVIRMESARQQQAAPPPANQVAICLAPSTTAIQPNAIALLSAQLGQLQGGQIQVAQQVAQPNPNPAGVASLLAALAATNVGPQANDIVSLLQQKLQQQTSSAPSLPNTDFAALLGNTSTAANKAKPPQDATIGGGTNVAAQANHIVSLLQQTLQQCNPCPSSLPNAGLASLLGSASQASELRSATVNHAEPTQAAKTGESDQVVTALRKTNHAEKQSNTSSAVSCAKRTLDEMLGQSNAQPSRDPELVQRLPPSSSASLASLGSTESAPGAQSMDIVRLYAASLPTNSPVRGALLAASSIVEAQNILKADIVRYYQSAQGPQSDAQGLGSQTQNLQQQTPLIVPGGTNLQAFGPQAQNFQQQMPVLLSVGTNLQGLQNLQQQIPVLVSGGTNLQGLGFPSQTLHQQMPIVNTGGTNSQASHSSGGTGILESLLRQGGAIPESNEKKPASRRNKGADP